FSGMTYQNISELYVFLGGSGATLGLVISILINQKDKHSTKIAKLAAPFSLFNINEIMVFGLPVILNKNFLIPFITVPLINLAISFAVLYFYPIPVFSEVSWTTPIFLNAYLSTDGNMMAILLQAILLTVNVWIYSYYFKHYTAAQSNEARYNNLASNLDIIPRLKSREDISANKAQTSIIKSNHKVNEITKLLNTETLMVYYQPKINVLSGTCNHYEALLRLKMSDGKISGPFFLENLELAGLAPIIDLWVCKEVKRQIGLLKKRGMNPKISVNIHPDTISDEYAIKDIQDILKGEDIEFEIIERQLLSSERAKSNLFSLKEKGFSISIDDFGVGYTSFETLHALPIDVVKLDKSLIDIIDQKKGFLICRHISNLCASLGYDIVAEGVETKEQLDVLKRLDIKYIQGYYFSPAIPMESMSDFRVMRPGV
ncbi:MAG: EAL domain-containing protein, partial [Pseudomonadota bacterium]